MSLLECLNNERISICDTIINRDNGTVLKFSTPLEDVAMIEMPEDNLVQLTNGRESYSLNFENSLFEDWSVE